MAASESETVSFGSMCVEEEEAYIHNGVGSGRGRVRLTLYVYCTYERCHSEIKWDVSRQMTPYFAV